MLSRLPLYLDETNLIVSERGAEFLEKISKTANRKENSCDYFSRGFGIGFDDLIDFVCLSLYVMIPISDRYGFKLYGKTELYIRQIHITDLLLT